jgi:NAD(P)-dependent dehydrogenase (short-subunit alcohol dehydrogenase family)
MVSLYSPQDRAAKEAGPVSGLVYAVGSIPLKPLKSTSAQDFLDSYALNVVGGALLLKACLPALTAGGKPGSAVFFSTVASRVGFPNHCAIAAAKGGVEGRRSVHMASLLVFSPFIFIAYFDSIWPSTCPCHTLAHSVCSFGSG